MTPINPRHGSIRRAMAGFRDYLHQDEESRATEPGGLTQEWLSPVSAAQPAPAPDRVPPEVAAAMMDPASRSGKYVLVAEIGRGAMGQVWKAWDTQLHRWAALKMLKLRNPRTVERFIREARAAAGLNHPNLIGVYGTGSCRGTPYIAMQLADGATIESLRGDSRRAAAAVRDAARAIHHAHVHGIVHRDLKPENILIDSAERVLITDFGLARVEEPEVERTTGPHAVIGTPAFMSPEQASGRITEIQPPSDIYSLGATLFYLCTGRFPSSGADADRMISNVAAGRITSPSRFQPGMSRDLEAVIVKAIEWEPANRYATADDLAADLDRYLRGEPVHARPPGRAESAGLWLRRHRRVVAAAGLVIGVIGASLLLKSQNTRLAGERDQAHRTSEHLKRRQAAGDRLAAIRKTLDRWTEGNAMLDRSEVAAVKRELDNLLASDPDLGAAWIEVGRYRWFDGDLDAAVDAFTRAMRDGETHADALAHRCRTRISMSNESLVEFGRAPLTGPAKRQLDHAVADLEEFRQSAPPEKRRQLLSWLEALVAFHTATRQEEYPAIAERFRMAREMLGMAPWESCFFEGRAWFRAGDYAQAVEALDLGFTKGGVSHVGYYTRGAARLHLARGQNPERRTQLLKVALSDFTASVERNPNYFPAWSNRAATQLEMALDLRKTGGDASDLLNRSIADSETAIRLIPSDADNYQNRGNAEMLLGRYQAALDSLNKAVELDASLETSARGAIEFCEKELGLRQ